MREPEPAASEWPASDKEPLTECPICGHDSAHVLHEALTDRVMACAPGTWRLVECAGCGAAFLNPRPTYASIGRAYARYFTHAAGFHRAEPASPWLWLRRALGNGYRNHVLGARLRPSLGLAGVLAAAVSSRHREALGNECAGLAVPTPRIGRKPLVLDVGCGNGNLLLRAQVLGWDAVGVEPDPHAAAVARQQGIRVLGATIHDVDAELDGTVDRITLSHVIEHVHDPLQLLSRCRRLLRPDGVLWLETPNIDSVGHALFGANWRGLESPRHLVIFRFEALRSLLKRAGFQNVRLLEPRRVERETFEASVRIAAGQVPMSGESLPPLTDLQIGHLAAMLAKASATIDQTTDRSEFISLEALP